MPRKYDIEVLKELAAKPKSKGGRPKKYHTEEERRAADAERHRKAHLRAKLTAEGKEIPEELRIMAHKFANDEERRHMTQQRRRRAYFADCEQSRLEKMVYWYRMKHPI